MGVQLVLAGETVNIVLRRAQSSTWPGVGVLAYPREVTSTEVDSDFAEIAGLRIEQAFALCSFASALVGKAGQ